MSLPIHLRTTVKLDGCIGAPLLIATTTGTSFSDIDPVLKARREIKEHRKVSAVAVARMLCWNLRKLWRCDADIRPVLRKRA